MSKPSKRNRPIVSILMLFGYLAILVTGLMSYVIRYSSLLSAVHTVFGLLFVVYGIFHLKNNIISLLGYFKQTNTKKWTWFSCLLIPVTVMALSTGTPPFQTVIDASYAIKELKPSEREMNETLYTRFDLDGRSLYIDIKAGPHYSGPGPRVMGLTISTTPQMVIWVEDLTGSYLETLYVTKKASNSSYLGALFSGEEVLRPEALPIWSHARVIKSEDGLIMPINSSAIVDAITGATPRSSFELHTKTEQKHTKVKIKLEINRSFDYNEKYHLNAFPSDIIYNGSGNSAQPSLIYSAIVDLEATETYSFMKLIGRGHHSGKDGEIYSDISGITTAKQMLSRIIVEVL